MSIVAGDHAQQVLRPVFCATWRCTLTASCQGAKKTKDHHSEGRVCVLTILDHPDVAGRRRRVILHTLVGTHRPLVRFICRFRFAGYFRLALRSTADRAARRVCERPRHRLPLRNCVLAAASEFDFRAVGPLRSLAKKLTATGSAPNRPWRGRTTRKLHAPCSTSPRFSSALPQSFSRVARARPNAKSLMTFRRTQPNTPPHVVHLTRPPFRSPFTVTAG